MKQKGCCNQTTKTSELYTAFKPQRPCSLLQQTPKTNERLLQQTSCKDQWKWLPQNNQRPVKMAAMPPSPPQKKQWKMAARIDASDRFTAGELRGGSKACRVMGFLPRKKHSYVDSRVLHMPTTCRAFLSPVPPIWAAGRAPECKIIPQIAALLSIKTRHQIICHFGWCVTSSQKREWRCLMSAFTLSIIAMCSRGWGKDQKDTRRNIYRGQVASSLRFTGT